MGRNRVEHKVMKHDVVEIKKQHAFKNSFENNILFKKINPEISMNRFDSIKTEFVKKKILQIEYK